jgi:hypothetical protein
MAETLGVSARKEKRFGISTQGRVFLSLPSLQVDPSCEYFVNRFPPPQQPKRLQTIR